MAARFLIHYLCQYQNFYLKYAVLSAHSLIHNGGVDPARILFTIDPQSAAGIWNKVIDQLGCRKRILPYPGPHKLVCVDWAFRTYPEIDTILQLDCDTYLAAPLSIERWVESLSLHPLVCYPMAECKAMDVYIERNSKINYPAMRYKPGHCSTDRLHRCLQLLCHVDYEKFYNWLQNEDTLWPWGTLVVLHRSLLGTAFWETAINYDLIGPCDESALMLGTFRDPTVSIHYLEPDPLPQILVEKRLRRLIAEKRGLLHYAGPQGKEGCAADIEFLLAERFPHVRPSFWGWG